MRRSFWHAVEPIAKLVPIPAKPKNRITFGALKGKIWMADDFDEPLPDELLKEWGLL